MEAIYFDMDGTLANLYAVEDWLPKLRNYDASPYAEAVPMLNLSILARYLNKLQKHGIHIGIISWLSKEPMPEYDTAFREAKLCWLLKHMKSVSWDEIHIASHGIPKADLAEYAENGILFDDEPANRTAWTGTAYDEKNILSVLKEMLDKINKA